MASAHPRRPRHRVDREAGPPGAPVDRLEQPFAVPLSVPTGDGTFPGSARRIMYRSHDEHDRPVAVTGTYFEPSSPWRGGGPRPLVSLASGTVGAGRQCAPSIALQSLVQYRPPIDASIAYEQLAVDFLLSRGMAVVFTDYLGLGTPGPHPYANRLDSAHAVIDAARAVKRLPRTSLSATSPVAFWGYSQGDRAVAAAAELQPSYAPEMRLVGTYSGAPPVQLADTGRSGRTPRSLGYSFQRSSQRAALGARQPVDDERWLPRRRGDERPDRSSRRRGADGRQADPDVAGAVGVERQRRRRPDAQRPGVGRHVVRTRRTDHPRRHPLPAAAPGYRGRSRAPGDHQHPRGCTMGRGPVHRGAGTAMSLTGPRGLSWWSSTLGR